MHITIKVKSFKNTYTQIFFNAPFKCSRCFSAQSALTRRAGELETLLGARQISFDISTLVGKRLGISYVLIFLTVYKAICSTVDGFERLRTRFSIPTCKAFDSRLECKHSSFMSIIFPNDNPIIQSLNSNRTCYGFVVESCRELFA